MCRCKLKHSFAFLQFRHKLPNALTTEIVEHFCTMKGELLHILTCIREIVSDEKLISDAFATEELEISDR